MKKLGFAADDEAGDLGLLAQGLVLREVDWAAPEDLAIVDLVELFLEIDSGLDSAEGGKVVQLIGASSGHGCAMVALDLGWAAVSFLDKKVLVLNCGKAPLAKMIAHHRAQPLESATLQPMSSSDDLVKVSDHELYMGDLRQWRNQRGSHPKAEEIRNHLEEFRSYFDMVVVAAPPADSDPLGAVLARHVDGNVLVIEAEWTRRSSAVRLREILTRCGRPILGTVLHDRQSHIPDWLARLL